jgi:hypothetical protein
MLRLGITALAFKWRSRRLGLGLASRRSGGTSCLGRSRRMIGSGGLLSRDATATEGEAACGEQGEEDFGFHDGCCVLEVGSWKDKGRK